jgi:hypothetical protein
MELKDIFKTKNIIVGVIWGTVSYYVGSYIVQGMEILNKIMDWLLKILEWIILLPTKVLEYIHLEHTYLMLGLAIFIGILLAPIALKVVNTIMGIFKKSPI